MLNFFIWLGVTLLALFMANRQYFDHFWAFCVFITGFIWESFVLIGDLTIRAFQYIATITAPGAPCGSGLGSYMALVNTFIPVDECLHLLAALVVLWIALGLYRLVKSWIPTLGGGS